MELGGPVMRGGLVLRGHAAVLRDPGAGTGLLAAWQADPAVVLSAPSHAGAAILVAAAEFTTAAASAATASAIAGRGFLAVIAPGFSQICCHSITTAGVLPLTLPIGKVSALQDIVEADSATLLTVDSGNREVTAGDKFSAIFEIAGGASGQPPGSPAAARIQVGHGGDTGEPGLGSPDTFLAAGSAQLAGRIRAVQLYISSLDIPADVQIHLQRRLVAVCDAMKAATADPARCERRLASLATELNRLAATRGLRKYPGL